MPLHTPILYDHYKHQYLLTSFVNIHIDCIETDKTTATFLPPLDPEKMLSWWYSRSEETITGHRTIVMLLTEKDTGADELAGYVMLEKPVTETGPFRGNVEKLLVSPDHCRKGVGRRLMMRLEEEARKEGRTLLMLGTETGSPADSVYPILGYNRLGIIPDFMISPDGTFKPQTFYYKNLLLSD